ncbi:MULTISPECIES: BglG family transcription antiterminator [unclassified Niallia]|uniref:BglG family transcription antiterminator n=1 Tax=unclassified Niallia TaxID=2837522 RepID=UPI001EDA8CB6|nr:MULTISPECIES: BglG family transcription antiterminator [unclassified Niallia]MDL0434905.1 BglG family transcription antiterminator [Niallia sp. SS-2023]UPO88718.1 BglG family transcription antiterminator [Niallia sp. Man26]
MLENRTGNLLKQLMAAEDLITSEQLSRVLHVTSRTIRNDMKELESLLAANGAKIKSVRGQGYKLVIESDQLFRKFLQESFHKGKDDIIPTLKGGRVHYIINRLLLTDKNLKLEDLAEELFISKSTIQNDLKEVKELLLVYDLKVEKTGNSGLRIKGDEVNLRFCMSEYLFNRKLDQTELTYDPAALLVNEELAAIRNIILEEIRDAGITLSDISLNNLVVHIAIACKRIREGNYISAIPKEKNEILKEKEYAVSEKIVRTIEEELNVAFPETEIAYIAIHLLGTKLLTHHELTDGEVLEFIDESIMDLTKKILAETDEKMDLGIKEDRELFTGLSLHLKPAINRFRYKMNLRNPLLDDIKSNYPIPFEAGVVAAGVINKELGYDIHENEIAFLALHFGAAMERKKVSSKKKRCMIVCASGVGSANLLYYKLKSQYSSELEMIGTTELYKVKEINFAEIDLIISTIPIKEEVPVPVIEVNTILGDRDFEKINGALYSKKAKNKADSSIRSELVFLQQPFDKKEEVFAFLEAELLKLGLIDESFMDNVRKREKVSPTCFGNLVAIPHPNTPQTEETFWAFCTLQKPIDWGGKNVQFVCLLSVQKNSTGDFQEMYDVLGDVLDSPAIIQHMLKCKSFSEFKAVFPS